MKNEINNKRRKAEILKKLESLKKKMISCGSVMRGSLVTLKMTCGNKKCQCFTDKNAKHPAKYFSVNIDKKTKLIYLKKNKIPIAKELNDNYLKLWNIINQMTLLNMELLRISD